MNINIGGQQFYGVQIPILWGTRAILQDQKSRLSVIDLSDNKLTIEILGDKPSTGVEYMLNIDGFTIIKNGIELYKFNSSEKIITGIQLKLPECQIMAEKIRVGTSTFSGNVVRGSSVGIFVTETGFGMGGPIPPNLAQLVF
jgi:hypothetical protein